MAVAGPACDVYAIEGLIEEGAEMRECWEGKGVGGLECEVDVWESFEAEVEGPPHNSIPNPRNVPLHILTSGTTHNKCRTGLNWRKQRITIF